MVTITTKEALQNELHAHRQGNQKIALVPTMGALHEGHLSLIQEAQQLADIVVCSIFVNPTQFNDPKDLEKYPRPIENDMKLLVDAGCHILFLPSVDEMYPSDDASWHIDLGRLDSLWEGEKRPGHFQGVTQIVYKLFRLVEPDIACFGQKDFQQVMVIQRLVELKKLPVHIHICPTVRSKDGLALSSRNTRLSEAGKQKALAIFRSLSYIKAHIHNNAIHEVKEEALHILTEDEGITVEYLAVCTARTLEEATKIEPGETYVALVVAWIEGVRLIDNMILT